MIETKIALKNAGKIAPESFAEYKRVGGLNAFQKALKMEPLDVLKAINDSGLRGRGGAGFSAGLKGKFTDESLCRYCGQKYIICNADEGEPGTFKDRAIMENDPHLLIEGILVAAWAIGATKGFIYIRGEYTDSIRKIQRALDNYYAEGWLGKVFDADDEFKLDLEIRLGAGSYLCGEELTLIESLEGKRGYPRIKPPFPAQHGLWQKPTLVHNVETFSHMPFIVENGADAYRKYGTKDSPGTKIFSISGDVNNAGNYETEMGVSLRELIEIAGGMKDNVPVKAILVGGAAGSFLSDEHLDIPLCYDSIKKIGGVFGSGAIMVLNETRDPLEFMADIMEFFKHESCGKCIPCRVGTAQLALMAQELKTTQAVNQEIILDKMQFEAEYIAANSLCPLGASPIIPISSFNQHLRDKI
ncbi:MAG: NADH-ubiquinone oxidoreductase-F iron-sulfur binding region domain-containing protein [Bacteroidota bacterium]|nr:NADH-ubiquinone oxidoreductase-F iron-sulfur binding region domain-containing protein [Bacteroidota bacterium]